MENNNSIEEIMDIVSSLQSEIAILKESQEGLLSEITAEREKTMKMKKYSALQLELTRAGATDAEYLIYKTNSDALFNDEGDLIEPENYVKGVKELFPSFFNEREVEISGVLPGETSLDNLPDTSFLTYSQEKRLLERN